ncbi:hypothetical protein CTZ27_11555 [Streptomyces griseocarneus]|nr:hypothetical protein CTZ27_11555 [Streptomyces griseocarneus]
MTYLVELPVVGAADGSLDVVKVEIEEAGDGLVRVARPGQIVARASRSLGDMLAGIRPVAHQFVEGFRGMAQPPDEIAVEFGVSLSAEADVIISSTAAQANFKVSLTWQRPSTGDPDPTASGPAPDGAL